VSEDLVLAERDRGIVTLVLNRPERRNALSPELCRTLADRLRELDEDPDARALIVRGAGTEAFSGGFDLGHLTESTVPADLYAALAAVEGCRLPTIALLFGHVVGAGLELAVSCDLRVAAEGAILAMPPARQGILYRYEGTEKLVRLVGPAFAKELFFTATGVPAARAAHIGLVNHLVPAPEAEALARELAARIAANAPLSVRGAKRMIDRAAGAARALEHADLDGLVVQARDSADRVEGRRAAQEKRSPRFEGR
jgi:enoyl-CoA hydratase/carnithine racemase